MEASLIFKYFPNLSDLQKKQIEQLLPLYKDWNSKINVVSRKDIDQLYLHHVLHSLSIAKFISFKPGTKILDLGCGGGFPGIPLAILFPEVEFHLVDSVRKKIAVVENIAEALELKNAKAEQARAEELKSSYDFVVTRAVAPLDKLLSWTRGKYACLTPNALPQGLIALKGGDLYHEIKAAHRKADKIPITDYFKEDYFKGKKLVYVAM
ncbi:MAG: 16S rRNA (guanine(527)-N(7))-methyltransferase RsmG [Chitinophagales bacterium]